MHSVAAPAPRSVPIDAVRAWLVDAALPLWLDTGVDWQGGGFEESLTLKGERIAGQNKRIRVQARQIYTASHAAVLGLHPNALSAARHGFEFLTGHAWHREGGWVHLLSAGGEVRNDRRDTYDHAFVLLALAWYYKASGDRTALTWIERTVSALDAVLGDGTGAYLESRPPALPRRQNPHMHCFEAMLALYDATGEASFAARAKNIHGLVLERFFDSRTSALREFYGDDWKPLAGPDGNIVEPGHHCEWVWLLDKFERLTATDTGDLRKRLLDFALKHGRSGPSGLLIDQVDVHGNAVLRSQRLWPQTEAIKALLMRVERGETAAWDDVAPFLSGLFGRYLAVEPAGIWHDHFGEDGRLLNTFVPASSLYHLFVAFSELLRVGGNKPG
jgi:mannose/cellobiose epimerase-like protein (N-acyl-D-glucosamine 2-epimerase family)